MKFVWLTPSNVTKVANALLQIDSIHLQKQYHQEASYFTRQLQGALAQYQTPPSCEAAFKSWRTVESIETALIQLLNAVRVFLILLTPEVQQQLAQQFQSKKE